ncbi:Uncharacterized protein HZ326_31856, partial [Fusarium oxysporum f. sp. albedinis]
EMPDIRRTPVNEFNRSQALLSMAFPTLFPRGQADFVEPRLRPIKYADYIQHALRLGMDLKLHHYIKCAFCIKYLKQDALYMHYFPFYIRLSVLQNGLSA